MLVIPAKAGVTCPLYNNSYILFDFKIKSWIPALAGMAALRE
jgi:hypothetical protein